jgi:hypothetical protein
LDTNLMRVLAVEILMEGSFAIILE